MPSQHRQDDTFLGDRATERRLHRLWRQERHRLPALECDDGTLLRVVYAGRPSAAAAPTAGSWPQLCPLSPDARVHALTRLLAAPARSGDRDPEEVLYKGLPQALGYSKNREPFVTLAQGCPSPTCGGPPPAFPPGPSPAPPVHAPGCVGIFRNKSPAEADPAMAAMEERWRATGASAVVPQRGWHLFRVRPDNPPRRRLTGMALLLERVWDQGLLATLAAGVRGADVTALRSMLTVTEAPAVEGRRGAAYIGSGHAGEMAVNVLLPFCAAWGAPAWATRASSRPRGRCTGGGRCCRRTRLPGR